MAMKTAKPGAFLSFPPASEADWRRLVERALQGRPFDSLVTSTFEGLSVEPLYPRAIGDQPRAWRENPHAWQIAQRIDHPDPETANALARKDLEGGAHAFTLTVSPAWTARGFGVGIESERDLDAVFAGIDLDLVPLRLEAGERAPALLSLLAGLATRRRLTSAALDIDCGFDPIGLLARSGTLRPLTNLREMHERSRNAGFAGRLLLADGRPYHEAGAADAQELACVIGAGVDYLRFLHQQGLSLDEARGAIAFLLAADADEFLSLAKFRALRFLWAQIESACGLAPKRVRLRAETSFRMMTRYDPWANIFRTTMGAFCAALGGADEIIVLPYTIASGLPDEAARRLARNIGLIMLHEAKLAKVADPAAGAGSFETLTDELCTRAWRLFQEFEAAGGMIKALRAGLPQQEIAAAARARRTAIAHRAAAITGTSAFPLLDEREVHVLMRAPSKDLETAPGSDCVPLAGERDGEPYELLREAADAKFASTGKRPEVFLFVQGSPQDHGKAPAMAANFFAAAGIAATLGEGTLRDQEREFCRSGARIACICARRMAPIETLIEAATALRKAGAKRVYLAQEPGADAQTESQRAGADDLICSRSDALAILNGALTAALGGS